MPDPIEEFLTRAHASGVGADADKLLKRWDSTSHLPGLVQSVKRNPGPPSLLPLAQEVLAHFAAKGIDGRQALADGYHTHALVGILARDGGARSVEVLRHFLDLESAKSDEEFELLHRTLTITGQGDDIARLTEEVARLVPGADPDNEALAWAARHAPKLKGKWEVNIWIADGEPLPYFGYGQTGPQMHLHIEPHGSAPWTFAFRAGPEQQDRRKYEQIPGFVYCDGYQFPIPSRLEDFPQWLRTVGEIVGTRFDTGQALVRAGRMRSVQQPIRDWLGSAGTGSG